MPDETGLTELNENHQLVEKSEWDRIAQAIRDKMAEIEKEFGDAPPKYVRTRKGAGGKDWSYVRPDFCEIALHKHVPDWSYDKPNMMLVSEKDGHPGPTFVAISGISFTIAGVRRFVGGVGEKQLEFTYRDTGRKDEKGNPIKVIIAVPGAAKAADSDCFKRCCIRALRLARNVYKQMDDEFYAQFALKENDIEALRNHEEMLKKIQERADGDDMTTAKVYLEEIRRILGDPEEAMRYEVLDLAKAMTNFENIFTENWRKTHETG